MSKIHMLTTADKTIDRYSRNDFDRLSAAVCFDVFREHSLVDSPDLADIILFVGSTYPDHRDVRAHPFLRSHKQKCFLFHSDDYVIPFLPGVYVNITRRWYSQRRTRTGFYLRVFDSEFISHKPSVADCEYLFCFIGSTRTHPVRGRILSLKHPRAHLEDTSALVAPDDRKKTFFMVDYRPNDSVHYGDVLARSKFVICPRGYACSSWRLFETMKAGRVPVIVSDEWVPPEGPAWESFSIRVRESDVAQIPRIVEEQESMAETMGRLARATWESWFSREACFHRIVEWCLRLKQYRNRQIIDTVGPYFQLMRPHFVRHVLLPDIKKGVLNRLPGRRGLLE